MDVYLSVDPSVSLPRLKHSIPDLPGMHALSKGEIMDDMQNMRAPLSYDALAGSSGARHGSDRTSTRLKRRKRMADKHDDGANGNGASSSSSSAAGAASSSSSSGRNGHTPTGVQTDPEYRPSKRQRFWNHLLRERRSVNGYRSQHTQLRQKLKAARAEISEFREAIGQMKRDKDTVVAERLILQGRLELLRQEYRRNVEAVQLTRAETERSVRELQEQLNVESQAANDEQRHHLELKHIAEEIRARNLKNHELAMEIRNLHQQARVLRALLRKRDIPVPHDIDKAIDGFAAKQQQQQQKDVAATAATTTANKEGEQKNTTSTSSASSSSSEGAAVKAETAVAMDTSTVDDNKPTNTEPAQSSSAATTTTTTALAPAAATPTTTSANANANANASANASASANADAGASGSSSNLVTDMDLQADVEDGELDSEARALLDKVQESGEHMESLERQLKLAQDQLQDANAELKSRNRLMEAHELQFNKEVEDKAQIANRVIQLQHELQRLEAVNTQHTTHASQLEREIQVLQAANERLQEKVAAMQTVLDVVHQHKREMDANLREVMLQIEVLSTGNRALQRSYNRVRDELRTADEREAEYKKQIAERDQRILALEAKVGRRQQKIVALRTKFLSVRGAYATLKTKFEQTQEQLDESRQRVKVLTETADREQLEQQQQEEQEEEEDK